MDGWGQGSARVTRPFWGTPALGLSRRSPFGIKGRRNRSGTEHAGGPSPAPCAPSRPGERSAHDRTFALH